MSKIQTMIWLFVLIIIVFSMDMIFGNPLRETFKGVGVAGGRNVSSGIIGSDYVPSSNNVNGGFLASVGPSNHNAKSDDQPLHFSFPFYN